MFVRAKKSGPYQYLQVVENRREGTKVVQRVISTLGRLDRLNAKGDIESLVRSLSRFSEETLLVLSGKSDLLAEASKIGPALIFERLWVLSPKKNGPRYERLGGSGELIFSVMPAAVFEPLAAHCVIS